MNELIINYNSEEKNIEVCVIEDNSIIEYYSHGAEDMGIIGNIYCGIVQNVVDGMQAAFVDIGIEKNTFISIKDALPKVDVAKEEQIIDQNMSEILKKGDKLLVQIRKEPSYEKGARVSTHITLPGNYIVLMPETNIITISQKISDESEAQRLKDIVKDILPNGYGAIVRTDAENISKEALEQDISDVVSKWKEIKKKYNEMSKCGILYDDHDIVMKTARQVLMF